jgi:hypothetical protein
MFMFAHKLLGKKTVCFGIWVKKVFFFSQSYRERAWSGLPLEGRYVLAGAFAIVGPPLG